MAFLRDRKALTKHFQSQNKEIKKLAQLFKKRLDKIPSLLERQGRKEFRQFESFYWLNSMLKFKNRFPWLRSWVASPDLLLYIYEIVLEKKPKNIVEFGSGFSTIVIAKALQQNGCGHITSLEHMNNFVNSIKFMIDGEDLSEFADIRHSPLITLNTSEEDSYWYDSSYLSDLSNIDLVIIDGPPAKTCKHARYPAIPALINKLDRNALIILDDANRTEEKEIISRWQEEYELCVEIYKEFDKGLAVIKLKNQ